MKSSTRWPQSRMPRRFTDARLLITDLLDRHEGGTESPIGYPDYASFVDVGRLDKFTKELREAEGRGAIRITKDRGLNSDQIKHGRLEKPALLYALLGRRPAGELTEEATRRLLEGLDLPAKFEGSLASLRAA